MSGALSKEPLAVSIKAENALRVHALNAAASKLGLAIGHPLANARAMVPHLHVVEADEKADAKLLEGIADWCDRFTPYVALDPPHGLFLDLTGCTHLLGGERLSLDHIRGSVAEQGFTVGAGIAGTAAAAYALSRFANGTIAEPGREAEALAPLPVAALNFDSKIEHALKRAGLKTIGQVAMRNRSELASRFGKAFVFHLERALGRSQHPINPLRPIPDFIVERRFAEPIMTEDMIVETLVALAKSLGEVLETSGKGARILVASFYRADGAVRRIGIETGSPTRDSKIVERLFKLKLDTLADPIDPGFGFDLIRLEATLAQKDTPDAVGFDRDTRAEREIAQLIDCLSVRFGAHRILRFVPQNTHIPEAEAALVPAQSSIPATATWEMKRSESEMPQRPLRLFEKPELISVMAQIPDGPPLRFRWRQVLHTATFAAGPESIAMEWWRHQETMPMRDYFRVEDDTGRRFWMYRDGPYGRETGEPRWYMHGVFA
jgi:protein ImuB